MGYDFQTAPVIYFYGDSHAVEHLRTAAQMKGLEITHRPEQADLLFVSHDTPTAQNGERDTRPIVGYLTQARKLNKPIVLTSQVPPGFTRALCYPRIYHQSETLRIKDAMERALNPEQIIVGCVMYESYELLPAVYRKYLEAFDCPVEMVSYEDAEFAKIAINMFLAAQVNTTNTLHEAAQKCGAQWWYVKKILQNDRRIGPHAYLTPGRWQDSLHLLRDHVTLERILARKLFPLRNV